MFDTHCHLNFKAFKKNLPEVIDRAKEAGVKYIVIPGTDVKTSKNAVEIAQNHENLYAAVGIHPHHVYKLMTSDQLSTENDLKEIEVLLSQPKVVALGEIGIDRHEYENTKYETYSVDERFIELQKELFTKQINLALKHNKSIIFHNREAKADVLKILDDKWNKKLEYRTVFHCCEPDEELLEFAIDHKMFIGVDGDITYYTEKQEFIKKVPLDMLVLETDSPFLLPEPLRSQKKYPNGPQNMPLIAEFIAKLMDISTQELEKQITENAKKLFHLV